MTHSKTGLSDEFSKEMAKLECGLPAPESAGFLGADFSPDDCKLVLIPVPWEATTSYGGGTSQGPEAILKASHQLDLEDQAFGKAYRSGIAFLDADPAIGSLNKSARDAALKIIEACERGEVLSDELSFVNQASESVNRSVFESAQSMLEKGKFVGVVGGDHASPQGLIAALSKRYSDGFGILHFDAHHDLRVAYEGFVYSHASIFYNVMSSYQNISKLVQVGIRDYSRDEKDYMTALAKSNRGQCFYGRDIFAAKAEGKCFRIIAEEIVNALPSKVYVSFDIDGLDPSYCPSTGTPVPGGLSYDEACYILEALGRSGKKVIGFDLCEVAPAEGGGEWDANVGARLLYKLCGLLTRSQGLS